MTLKSIGALLGAAAITLLAHNLAAQGVDPWVTVDAYHPVDQPVTESGNAGDITISPATGQLYSVGGAGRDQEGNWVATIRGSVNGDNNWTTLDTYSVAGWPWSHFRGVAADSLGRLFAAGELYNPVGPEKTWIVRESPDFGQTWVTVDSFAEHSCPSAADVKVSPSGDVYAAGVSSDSAASWIVRKRAAGQSSFATVDSVGNGQNSAHAIAFHPAGAFVAGYLAISGRSVWSVRKSSTGASGTWMTVDSFMDTQGYPSLAMGIAVDAPTGTIYVTGRAEQIIGKGKNARRLTNWVVRRSTNGGTTWTVVDRFGAVAGGLTITANAVAVDAADGVVFVAGTTPDRWLVRKGTPGPNGISWVTSDEYQLVAGRTARANAITIDQATGNVYVTGGGNDASDTYPSGMGHWITRKLTR